MEEVDRLVDQIRRFLDSTGLQGAEIEELVDQFEEAR